MSPLQPQEFIELRNVPVQTSMVIQVADSGNVERMNLVCELQEQTKQEIYIILSEK